MKKSGIVVASISAAASVTTISASSTNTSVSFSSPESNCSGQESKEKQRKEKGSEDEKFAPRLLIINHNKNITDF
ncbi:hypothetical protein V5N11_015395 [Cardamine amara subsp. amara]|uniref:Uncharacterized protein n=1 Tax=Cardamine amara subsp. amara TaxID=228776 RepID=A0ABD1AGJ2_CARAN